MTTSVIFYWLLVKVPEWQKRRRLRRHMAASYKAFRRETVTQLMFAATKGRAVDYDEVITLSDMLAFKVHFKSASEQVEGSRWDDVANGMTESIRSDLGVALSLLRDDVSYILNNTDIDDEKSFLLLQALQKAVSMQLLAAAEPEDDRNLLNLLWQIMAGWDWLEGYPKEDRVQALIERI